MTTRIIKSVALLLCLAVGLWAADPWLGTWKLNVAKSKFDPGPPPKSRTQTAEMVGDQIRSTSESVESDGRTSKSVWIGKSDGKPYPVEGSTPGVAAAVKRVGANVEEMIVTMNGKPTWTSQSTLSKNGRIFKSVEEGVGAKGVRLRNVTVWEKQ